MCIRDSRKGTWLIKNYLNLKITCIVYLPALHAMRAWKKMNFCSSGYSSNLVHGHQVQLQGWHLPCLVQTSSLNSNIIAIIPYSQSRIDEQDIMLHYHIHKNTETFEPSWMKEPNSQWALPFVEGISYQWDLWVVFCLDIQYLLHFFVFVESHSDSRKSSRSCCWWSRTGEKPGTHAVTPWMLLLGAATLSLLLSF